MKFLKVLLILPLAMGLSQCDQVKLKPKAAAPSAYAFDIKLDITPAAAELMKEKESHFIVGAFYFGRAKPETRAEADAMGRIKLGYEQIGIATGTTQVHLPVADFDTSKLSAINGDPQTRVTFVSANKVGAKDDLIDCKSYFGIIKTAQAKTPVVACDVHRF